MSKITAGQKKALETAGYAQATAEGWTADALHLNALGLADKAMMIEARL